MKVAVAGAGVFGLSIAFTLQRAGLTTLLVDPSMGVPSASSVAAGLLAPIGEAVFDPLALPHRQLLQGAYGRWPIFAAAAGITTEAGVVLQDAPEDVLKEIGCNFSNHSLGLFSLEDSRVLDPGLALQTLLRGFEAAGGQVEHRRISNADWRVADQVVLAIGAGASGLVHQAPELARLSPIKGQIAVLPHGPREGPVVRWPGGYLAPHPTGARAGATMEVGKTDTLIEPSAIARLADAAAMHVPGLDVHGAQGLAGVRMTTPDTLPLVGPSIKPRTLLAIGARRNGWLFAPLVAELVLAYCISENPGRWAEALRPGRFAP